MAELTYREAVARGIAQEMARDPDVIFFGEALATAEDGLTPWVAQIAIATSFGLAHLYGIPNGWIGISMAATWGFVLARLRLKTRGMLATYVTHVCADATIVAMLLPAVL